MDLVFGVLHHAGTIVSRLLNVIKKSVPEKCTLRHAPTYPSFAGFSFLCGCMYRRRNQGPWPPSFLDLPPDPD
jgi:hypothetical protein